MVKPRNEFLDLLRKMSKKGFFEILLYIESNPNVHYNEVLKSAIDKKIIKSGTTITRMVKTFTEMGILERKIEDSTPIRTTYSVTAKGRRVIKLLKEMDKATK